MLKVQSTHRTYQPAPLCIEKRHQNEHPHQISLEKVKLVNAKIRCQLQQGEKTTQSCIISHPRYDNI